MYPEESTWQVWISEPVVTDSFSDLGTGSLAHASFYLMAFSGYLVLLLKSLSDLPPWPDAG